MNQEIKDIVDKCNITEKRIELENNKVRMFFLDREMAKMKFNRTIGLYAYKLDELEWLMSKGDFDYKLYEEIKNMEEKEDILIYKMLRDEFYRLKATKGEYEKAINVDLRLALMSIELPSIYIEQKDGYKNIINPYYEVELKNNSYIISPVYNVCSNRIYRHFYNKTSFHYLEELSNDYNYELKNKKIGKIKIKKM